MNGFDELATVMPQHVQDEYYSGNMNSERLAEEAAGRISELQSGLEGVLVALRDVQVNRGPRPSETSCGCEFMCICPDERARAILAQHKGDKS